MNITLLNAQINELLTAYPDLADDDVLRHDMFEAETSLHYVIEKLVAIIDEDEILLTGIKARSDELKARANRIGNRVDHSRALILDVMQKADLQKITLPAATLSTRITKPSPLIVDETLLPDHCFKIERKPSMTQIRLALDAGETLQGIAMSNGKPSLTIRTK